MSELLLIKGVDKTSEVECFSPAGEKCNIKFTNSKKWYSYNSSNVAHCKRAQTIDISAAHIFIKGHLRHDIERIVKFDVGGSEFYGVEYQSGTQLHYPKHHVEIRQSCLVGQGKNVFDYLRFSAQLNRIGSENDFEQNDGKGILSWIYDKVDFVDETTAAGAYLAHISNAEAQHTTGPIFPFSCNLSQITSVKKALENQISVIQGPPGTGKTQTILNIIANLLLQKKSVLVVSNNNSATDNVVQKLRDAGLGFLVAPLGRRENKENFILNQPELPSDLHKWKINDSKRHRLRSSIGVIQRELESVFESQRQLATLRQELADAEIELTHYEQENQVSENARCIAANSSKIIKILQKLKRLANDTLNSSSSFWKRLKSAIRRLDLEWRLKMILGIKSELTSDTLPSIVTNVEFMFYTNRIDELRNRIEKLEKDLKRSNEKQLSETLAQSSMDLLKATLAERFQNPRTPLKDTNELYHNGAEVLTNYPVVTSTTFSARLCFKSDTVFDYVIMDEASQVGIDTGFLALTVAKRAVIVGDTMQLPNVVTDEDKLTLNNFKEQLGIEDAYDASRHSFLSSVLAALPMAPQTLLREHYRCHPDIINFCNQKFYGGKLLIMTDREDDENALLAITTSAGTHARQHFNQREIDVVKLEVLPRLTDKELASVGIIAPYNNQVNAFRKQLPSFNAATIHKFQGREKETIIMSVTDDVITEFSDNANLLNVAVSRARKKFCIVVSGNPQPLNGNINHLLGYIRYHKGIVVDSEIRSIYDYLFTEINKKSSHNVSEYKSENVTYELLEQIRENNPTLSHIKTLCHYPLRSLVKDSLLKLLSEREKSYATHPSTHIDFLVINRVDKTPLLAIETDGYSFHREGTEQHQRDLMKNNILNLIGLPLLRLSTIGHSEESRIINSLENYRSK